MTSQPFRLATPSEISDWDRHVESNPDGGTLLQTSGYAAAKHLEGWRIVHLVYREQLFVLLLERRVLGLGRLWYVPTGPGVDNGAALAGFAGDMAAYARAHGVFLVKLESEIDRDAIDRSALATLGMVKAPSNVQMGASTVFVDLTPDLDAILAHMPQKGRYSIKKAARDGVSVAEVDLTDENLRTMYDLLTETGRSAGFPVRSYEYYATFWRGYGAEGAGHLFFATVDGEVVAGAYMVRLGTKAWYKDGASVRHRPAYGASNALQWAIISWLKQDGLARSYDLGGTPPSESVKDPDHPLYGVGMFKLSLTRHVVDHMGTYDLVIRPRAYAIWLRIGWRIAQKVHRTLRHEPYF